MNPRTVAAANGIAAEDTFGAVTPPICLSSTFTWPGFGRKGTHDYTRTSNPTRTLLADTLAKLEGGAGAVVVSSGMAAIDLVLAGGRYMPPRVAELAAQMQGGASPAAESRTPKPAVTARQADVLRLVADGYSNKEIARALDLSPATVKTHVAQTIAAIGATNRTEAAIRARALGLI